MSTPQTLVSTLRADGVEIFYRSAGPPSAPAILLLHGFPSSSHQFRNLIPLLARTHRVIAPDLPGYGFTTVPVDRKYEYTFANLTTTIEAFVAALALKRFAVYIFDYGAPVGLRLALKHPAMITAVVSQNGNAYEEGFGKEFWAPVRGYWEADSATIEEVRKAIREKVLVLETTKWQYEAGNPRAEKVQPEAYYLDQALMEREGNKEVQLDLLRDYRTNVPLYPEFQRWFRESGVPVLAVWGKNDVIFVKEGADAFERDVKVFEKQFVDSGHFALETNEEYFAEVIEGFLKKHVVV
ncbi:MAG: hypothetical protein OHK93_006929 [Ramalina farinacea]|uniref:AB hydrolase-1 domain-containing protein n=1 Tax=Ramalina farinacea TaxID=258253 RepID=A0AA43QMX9_9LECA|nr:hypothetical protein [Ramalina farinacea]